MVAEKIKGGADDEANDYHVAAGNTRARQTLPHLSGSAAAMVVPASVLSSTHTLPP